MNNNAITVGQLNLYVKSLIEGDANLAYIAVTGEISNFKNHFQSGHWYFTLKDNDASIRCVMFKAANQRIKFIPQDGEAVILLGRVSLYEKDGQYQFYAEQMLQQGEGDIASNFNLIKEKLEKEGLFDPATKRPIPKFPNKIAVVTSEGGAAVQDILTITARRYPLCEILICPVLVQGENAAKDMIIALDKIYELDGIDLIIIGRGGGSAEDLSQYNDEMLARKVYESPVPVISAVGHETDFTICDFVSDLRAPTPSAAAEMAVPDKEELLSHISKLKSILSAKLSACYENSKLKFEKLSLIQNKAFIAIADSYESRLEKLKHSLESNVEKIYSKKSTEFTTAVTSLDALSPLKVMARGYSVATHNNTLLKSVDNISVGDSLTLRLNDGSLDCSVTKVKREQNNGKNQ